MFGRGHCEGTAEAVPRPKIMSNDFFHQARGDSFWGGLDKGFAGKGFCEGASDERGRGTQPQGWEELLVAVFRQSTTVALPK